MFLVSFQVKAETSDWEIIKNKHFVFCYREDMEEFVKEIFRKVEKYYDEITEHLGFKRTIFWTLENKCKIYFYRDQPDCQKNTKGIGWSKGQVYVIKKEIFIYVKMEQFFEYILPHEMGHIIFREFVGFNRKLSLWLDERVAVFQAQDRHNPMFVAKGLMDKGQYRFLEELSRFKDCLDISPRNFYS